MKENHISEPYSALKMSIAEIGKQGLVKYIPFWTEKL